MRLGTVLGTAWIAKYMQSSYWLRHLFIATFLVQDVIAMVLAILGSSSFIFVLLAMTLYGSVDALFAPLCAHMGVVTPPMVRGQLLGMFNLVILIAVPFSTTFPGWLLTLVSPWHLAIILASVFILLAGVSSRIAAFRHTTNNEESSHSNIS